MGEARRRHDALTRREPLERDLHRCPKCLGHRTIVEMNDAMGLSHVPTLYGFCATCKIMWEAFPPGWKHDPCEGEPCDNCAFGPGSPESQDKAAWRSMLVKLRAGQEFRCHKGAPLIIDNVSGEIEFDAAWVQRHGRTCVGFLRCVWKWGDWLENRYSIGHVLTKYDQDRLMGPGLEGDAP